MNRKKILTYIFFVIFWVTFYSLNGKAGVLMDKLLKKTRPFVQQGTVPEKYFFSQDNIVDLNGHVSQEVFNRFQGLIAEANHEILIQTFWWESQSQAAQKIFKGLIKLNKKHIKSKVKPKVFILIDSTILQRAHGKLRKVVKKFKAENLGPVPTAVSLSENFQDAKKYILNFAKKIPHVEIKIQKYEHAYIGSLHGKTLVVDGQIAMVMGTNPQNYLNEPHAWYDLGFTVAGTAAKGMRHDFISAWVQAVSYDDQFKEKSKALKNFRKKIGCSRGLTFTCRAWTNIDAKWQQKNMNDYRSVANDLGLPLETNFKTFPSRQFIQNNQGKPATKISVALTTRVGNGFPEVFKGFSLWFNKWVKKQKSISQGYNIDNTQDQAYIAAFGSAKKHIHILTPNLNDDDAIKSLAEAVSRGVKVKLITTFGFNRSTENYPGQGGDNRKGYCRLYKAALKLTKDEKKVKNFLHLRWYTRPDGVRIDDSKSVVDDAGTGRPDAMHAKYATIDNELAIVGTANMDTQSWNHSREINLAVDSKEVTIAWDKKLFTGVYKRSDLWEGPSSCKK
ncbi:phospholipase D-like domain-containing protein [Bacteriovoracales bacterium]|nr:phospholipase D-like domain-containing protein [Bacteriovoracales bacterium]